MWLIWTLAVVLAVLWLAGMMLHLVSPLLHLLIIAAAVLFVVGMFTGRARV